MQGSLGPNVDKLVAEAEQILEELKDRNFEAPKNGTGEEYDAAEECKSIL